MKHSASLILFGLLRITQVAAAPNCGPGVGSCAPGLCCSTWGYCGDTSEHCGLGKCQSEYSDSCQKEGSTPPPAGSLPRPRFGNVPYGTIIDQCTTPGKIALTYDDGPYIYTPALLDLLSSLQVPATFFITGTTQSGSPITSTSEQWPAIIRRMHAEGHQLASHTWSHASLWSVSPSIQRSELILNENAFLDLLGFYPTYFRCPYLECDGPSGTLGLVGDFGYHVIGTNADTKDYLFNTPETIQNAKDNFRNAISGATESSSYVVLAHDVKEQTVVSLTRYMIEHARERGFELVTVGDCLGDPRGNWYRNREGNPAGASPNPAVPTTLVTTTVPAPTELPWKISEDQTCGREKRFLCKGSPYGNCCSKWGYCGSTEEFCGANCNPEFGDCN